MRLGLLGDTHLDEPWILLALQKFQDAGLLSIVQVGDLGVWPGAEASEIWNRVDTVLAGNGQTMYVAPGNHEDYDQIERLVPNEEGWLPFRDRILLAPRGLRSAFDGVGFAWLGGAASVDRAHRLSDARDRGFKPSRDKTWWEQEAISDDDVARTIAGGHADVMVSHEAPVGVESLDRATAELVGYAKEDLEYAREVRARLTRAFVGASPRLLLHGHYHFKVDETWGASWYDFSTRVVGLACNDTNFAMGELDTATLEVTLWDMMDDLLEYRHERRDARAAAAAAPRDLRRGERGLSDETETPGATP
jgi:hypothetical protein